jgi:hypothetical protein
MPRRPVGGIYFVEAKKDGVTEHWAAATLWENAVAAVEKELGPEWIVTLTDGPPSCQPATFDAQDCVLTQCGNCKVA